MTKINEFDIYIADKVKKRRLELGLSQLKLAEKMKNIIQQQIANYENKRCRISVQTLRDLAKALNVDLDYFFKDFKDD